MHLCLWRGPSQGIAIIVTGQSTFVFVALHSEHYPKAFFYLTFACVVMTSHRLKLECVLSTSVKRLLGRCLRSTFFCDVLGGGGLAVQTAFVTVRGASLAHFV